MSRILLLLSTVFSLLLCSCGKKQLLLDSPIAGESEKSKESELAEVKEAKEVALELKSALAESQKELEKEKEKGRQAQEEQEELKEAYERLVYSLFGYALMPIAIAACYYFFFVGMIEEIENFMVLDNPAV